MFKSILTTGVLVALVTSVHAFTLDWDEIDWLAGAEQSTFSNVGGSGIDVTISLSLSFDTAQYENPWWKKDKYKTTTDWINNGPDDNNTFGGDGYETDQESLYLGLNFATNDWDRSYLDVTIQFSQSVDQLGFQLFDVDSYGDNYWGGYETGIQFVDIIERIESEYQGSAGPSLTVNHDPGKIIAQDAGEDVRYFGNTILDDDGTDQSDNPLSVMQLQWNGPVDQVSFRYSPGSDSVIDPGNQAIGLSDISFHAYHAVPEPGTVLTGGVGSLIVLFSALKRRKKARSNRGFEHLSGTKK